MKTELNGKNVTNKRYANIKEVSEYTSLPVKSLYELGGYRTDSLNKARSPCPV